MSTNLAASLVIGAVLSGTFMGTTGRAQRHIGRLSEEIDHLNRRRKKLASGNVAGLDDVARNIEIGQVAKDLDALQKRRDRLERSFHQMSAGKDMMGSALKGIGSIWAGSQIFLKPIRAASSFEDAMLGVAKQLDGARDANGKLTPAFYELRAEIQAMGREIPMATNDIAEMAAAGLRMGVAKDEVLGFVRTSAKMATAFEMPAGQLAEEMGKIAGIYKIPIGEIEGLADTINYLDDNAQSKGGDIIEVMKRIGGMASMVGMSSKDAAALGSTFLTLGASAEVASTATNAVIRELSVAASQPKRFQDGLKELGLEAEQLQRDMARNATGTIQMVLDKLNALDKERQLTVATQLFGKEYGDDVSKLAGGIEEYRRQLALANSEKSKGSMQKEADAKKDTASAQWQLFQNQWSEFMVSLGDQMLPTVKELLKGGGAILEGFSAFAKENGAAIAKIFSVSAHVALAVVTAKFLMFVQGLARYLIGSSSSGGLMIKENATQAWEALKKLPEQSRNARASFKKAGSGVRDVALKSAEEVRRLFSRTGRAFSTMGHRLRNLMAESGRAVAVAASRTGQVLSAAGLGMRRLSVSAEHSARAGAAGVGRAFSAAGRGVGRVFVGLGRIIRANPMGLALTALAAAAFLVYKNWGPIKQFFVELWEGAKEKTKPFVDWMKTEFSEAGQWFRQWADAAVFVFNEMKEGVGKVFEWISEKLSVVMGGIKKASEWIDEKTKPAQNGYWSLRGGTSDLIEGIANLVTGTERIRADESVELRRPPPLPSTAGRGAVSQHSTVTINVTQQPGENGEALARRVAQAQVRAEAIQNRGALYDQAMAY